MLRYKTLLGVTSTNPQSRLHISFSFPKSDYLRIHVNSPLFHFSVSAMFQSFTEGELQHVIGTLLDRKGRTGQRSGETQTRRTKRARRPKPCSLRELELTVSELGLGYDSDETVLLRYCSGKCTAHRQNYDITMEHMTRTGFKKKGRKDKVSNGPCCRPTAYEKEFSFLDNKSRYHTVQNVSAKNCGCVWPQERNSPPPSPLCCSKPLSEWSALLKDSGLLYLLKKWRKYWNIYLRLHHNNLFVTGRPHGQPVLRLCSFQGNWKWLFITIKVLLCFDLCSNTVNCGVTTM